jgi:hypothetical protein
MALQACRECGRSVSTEAATCPHCGTPRPTARAAEAPAHVIQPEDLATPASAPSRAREVAGTALGWVIGWFLGLAALGVMTTDLFGGFLYLVAAAVVLPPVNSWLKGTLNLALSAKAKAWLVLGFLFVGSLAMARGGTRREERETARAASTRTEALRADFTANGPAILARMDSALRARNYALAASLGQKFAGAVTDSQLVRRTREAQAGQAREANRAKEQALVARAAATPAGNLEANRDLYRQLVALNPTNVSYKAKSDDFNNRLRQQQAVEQDRLRRQQAVEQDRLRRFGPVPKASAWDGTYREVKDYLQQVANDPDRLKMEACTPVYHVANGWLVGCDYRGANAFGGIIRQSNWFIIRNGRVVEMKESSAYRP